MFTNYKVNQSFEGENNFSRTGKHCHPGFAHCVFHGWIFFSKEKMPCFRVFDWQWQLNDIIFFLRPPLLLSSPILNCASKKYEASPPSEQHWLFTSGFFVLRVVKINGRVKINKPLSGLLVCWLIMSLAERLSSKFHICHQSFASRPSIHFSDNL